MSKESSIKEYISKAKKIINDDEKLKKLIEDVLKKLKEISSDKKTSAKLNDSLRLFIRIINAYTSKEYTYVPWKTICLIVAGLIYLKYKLISCKMLINLELREKFCPESIKLLLKF